MADLPNGQVKGDVALGVFGIGVDAFPEEDGGQLLVRVDCRQVEWCVAAGVRRVDRTPLPIKDHLGYVVMAGINCPKEHVA